MHLLLSCVFHYSTTARSKRTRIKEKRIKNMGIKIEIIEIETEIKTEIGGTGIKTEIEIEIEEEKGLFPDQGMVGVKSQVDEIVVRIARKIENQRKSEKRKGRRNEQLRIKNAKKNEKRNAKKDEINGKKKLQ